MVGNKMPIGIYASPWFRRVSEGVARQGGPFAFSIASARLSTQVVFSGARLG